MFVWNLAVYFPVRWDELHDYGGVNAALKREVQRHRLQDAVVFVRTEGLIYNDGFFLNDPFMRANLIFARDLGPRNADLLAAHLTFRGYRWNDKRLEPMPEPAELSAEYRREDAVEDRR